MNDPTSQVAVWIFYAAALLGGLTSFTLLIKSVLGMLPPAE
jgi:hypothetical protein